jgi:histidinol-phosphate aminotransferase
LAELSRLQTPFTVNSAAGAAALAALDDETVVDVRRAANARNRRYLSAALARRGFDVRPSQANFVLVTPPAAGVAWAEELLARQVRVQPIGSGFRVTVGSPGEVRRLIDVIDELVTIDTRSERATTAVCP